MTTQAEAHTLLAMVEKVAVYTDGASRGNPGPAAIGIVFYDQNKEWVHEHKETLGVQTNNYAEYMAVIRALEIAKEKGFAEVDLYSDSQLMVRQMLGEYKVKAAPIIPLHAKAKELCRQLKRVGFHHVRREFNKEADALANAALDS